MSAVNTRSKSKKESTTAIERVIHEAPPESPPVDSGAVLTTEAPSARPPSKPSSSRPPSLRTARSSRTAIAARRQAEIEAAEKIAAIEKELTKKKLEITLAAIDDDENESQTSALDQNEETEKSKTAHIEKWIQNSFHDENQEPTRNLHNHEPPCHTKNQEQKSDIAHLADAIAQLARPPLYASGRPRPSVDLPAFNGNPHEWLAFKASYQDSEQLLGLSPAENLAKLRASLKGEAREAVSTLLFTTNDPNEVIQSLERRFGRPEAIVRLKVNILKKLPSVRDNNDLNDLSNKTRNCVETIKALKNTGYLHSPDLTSAVICKLTPLLRSKWRDYASTTPEDVPDLVRLSRFLDLEAEKVNRYDVIDQEAAPRPRYDTKGAPPARSPHHRPRTTNESYNTARNQIAHATNNSTCIYCDKQDHKIRTCDNFKKLDNNSRWNHAKENRLCFRCLMRGHSREECKAKPCGVRGCRHKHHRLLHNDGTNSQNRTVSTTSTNTTTSHEPEDESTTNIISCCGTESRRTFLKVVPVEIQGPNGNTKTFALLDEGATLTLVDSTTATAVGAVGPATSLHLEGINGQTSHQTQSQTIDVKIRGLHAEEWHELKGARTVENLSLHPQTVTRDFVRKYKHLKDIENRITYEQGRPTILIGQDHWDLIISREIRTGKNDQPVASKTNLGWTLHGYASRATINFVDNARSSAHEAELDELIKNNFALEAIGITKNDKVNNDERRALSILERTARRLPDGRYEVGLLWKEDETKLPNNYQQTLSRFINIERKMKKHTDFRDQYMKQMKHMIDSEYAEKVTEENSSSPVWYLPHFAVTNVNKPGKIRIVHDAAARTQSTSLNDALLTGPDLLQPLYGVLMRFRIGKYAFCGDIKEMFLQIKIRTEDRDALRFLWRNDEPSAPISTYRMTSLLFGAACSPCVASYIKNRNAKEMEEKFPEAVKIIINSHYMDDCVASVDNEEKAARLINEVTQIHSNAGFHIRGWTSNSEVVLENVPAEDRKNGEINLSKDSSSYEKTLGLMWDPATDTLGFNLNMNRVPRHVLDGAVPTKRQVLSVVMSIFDPLGLLNPVTTAAKVLIQEIWRSGIGWDDEIKNEENEKWQRWRENLSKLRDLQVPRHYYDVTENTDVELHIFCDASEAAYAAVAYWCFVERDGRATTAMIASKSRVAALKPTTIPRLELQAALIGCRLAESIIKETHMKPTKTTYWTDSTTVINWIRTDPKNYKPYVSHRLAEISEMTSPSQWQWVPSRLNTADLATRSPPPDFDENHRWFRGPQFLTEPESSWPERSAVLTTDRAEERKKNKVYAVSKLKKIDALPDATRFSTYLRLIRTTARIVQFIELCRGRTENVNATRARSKVQKPPPPPRRDYTRLRPLQRRHIERAKLLWIKAVQCESFVERHKDTSRTAQERLQRIASAACTRRREGRDITHADAARRHHRACCRSYAELKC